MATQIEKNTTDLQAILDAVNALPDAGGGGGIETATVTIGAGVYSSIIICYVDSSGNAATVTTGETGNQNGLTLTVMKKSLIAFTQGYNLTNGYSVVGVSGGVSRIDNGIFFVASSGTIFDDD